MGEALMEKMKNVHKISVGIPQEKIEFWDLNVDRRIILKYVLEN
jgi:hypothetical protein